MSLSNNMKGVSFASCPNMLTTITASLEMASGDACLSPGSKAYKREALPSESDTLGTWPDWWEKLGGLS